MRPRAWILLAGLGVGLLGLLAILTPSTQTSTTYQLVYALTPDHAAPQPLDGATVNGVIFPFITPDEDVDDVTFSLDGQVVWTEDSPPFDFVGGDEVLANPWRTTGTADGEHTISADLVMVDDSRRTVSATFTVANSTPQTGTSTPEATEAPVATAITEPATASITEPDVSLFSLAYALTPDHADSQPLDGATVKGVIYPFTTPDVGVDDVIFSLDGQVVWTEDNPPFDFAGGDDVLANPWDTTRISDGKHTISADMVLDVGVVMTITATFMVSNETAPSEPTPVPTDETTPTPTEDHPDPSPPEGTATSTNEPTPEPTDDSDDYTLEYSTSVTRDAPAALDGATVSGTIYIFLAPDTGVSEVRFSLDGTLVSTEQYVPFDFMGTDGSKAYPWDTTQVADGQHTITAEVLLENGTTHSISVTFTVSNETAPPEEPTPEPPPSGSGGSTEITTGAMLGGGYNPQWFYIRRNGSGWEPTYAGTNLAGRLMNFRAANALFDDEKRSDDNPEANTNAFIANFDQYKAHGILGMTVSLQGGNPGYEGALASAFNSDGSLKSAWMDRAGRVIEAADQRGMVIILTYFYQRQDQVLSDEAAVRQAVMNATDWLIASNYRNVIIEIANEYYDGGFQHKIIKNNALSGGIGELINLAKSRYSGKGWRVPVAASSGGILWSGAVADISDVALIHGNGIDDTNDSGDDTYTLTKNRVVDKYDYPVLMNEDDNGTMPGQALLDRDTHAMDDMLRVGGSWGLMWKPYNQLYPFKWSLGDPNNLNSESGYFHAILDVFQDRAN